VFAGASAEEVLWERSLGAQAGILAGTALCMAGSPSRRRPRGILTACGPGLPAQLPLPRSAQQLRGTQRSASEMGD